MTTFDERKKGFEKKFEKDQELQFKATARRNRLLGQWAAAELGLSGDEADAYAKDVVKADFARPGDDDVVEKVLKDFQAKNVAQSEHQIRRKMEDLLNLAREQIMTETSS